VERILHIWNLIAFPFHEATRRFLKTEPVETTSTSNQIAFICEVQPAEGRKNDYLANAAEMRPMLDKMNGFISLERFQTAIPTRTKCYHSLCLKLRRQSRSGVP
jgi:hypothetical protein